MRKTGLPRALPFFSMPSSQKFLIPCVLICALLWGSAFPAIKTMYRIWPESQSWDARLLVAGIRFCLAGLMLVPVAGWRGYFSRVKNAERWPMIAVALTQTFGQYLLFYAGLALSSGVLGALLISAGSFWWMLLAPPMLGSPAPRRHHWLALIAGAIGATVAVLRPGAGSGSPLLGGLCFLTAALCGALGIIFHTRLKHSIDTRTATSCSLAAGGVLLVVCGSTAWPEMGRMLAPDMLWLTLYLAFVSAAAFALWNWLARQFSANLLAGYRFLIPLSGMALSTLLIPGEKPGLGIFIGGGLIIGALIFTNRMERRAPEAAIDAR